MTDKTKVKVTTFDWKIWGKKFAKNMAYVIIAGAAVVWQENIYYLAAVPVLKALENAIRHW